MKQSAPPIRRESGLGSIAMSEKKLNKKLIIAVSIIAVVAIIATVAVIVLMPHRETVADVLDLGDRYMSELDYESAIREYKRAIEIDPRAEDAYLKLAEAYIALGDVDSAIEALEDGYSATQSERILARLNELRGGASGAHSPEDAESIVMASTPQKTTYNVGDMLDLTGLTLTVTYQDGATEVINDGYTCEVETLDEAGTQEVTVRYGEAETTVTVTVVDGIGTEPIETEPIETEPAFSIDDLPIAEDFAWTLEDGVLTISGHGRMPNYDYNEKPWYKREDEIETVIINDGITNICFEAFHVCRYLTSITIPDSVVSIYPHAFARCDRLSSIIIPDSVVSIGAGVFENCRWLTSINVSEDNQNYCSVGGVLFSKDMTELLCVPGGMTGHYDIPDGVTSVGSFAFGYCDDLTSITIPGSVISIGEYAFESCSNLTSISIPSSVVSIGESAFIGCDDLESIIVSDDNPNYCSLEGVLFTKDMTKLIAVPNSMTGSYNIPYGVISIESDAFLGCRALTSITIPDSVIYIGSQAISYCDALTSITIPDSVVIIGNYEFSWCENLTSITIPDSVTSIGEGAFNNCPNLTIHAPAGSAAETYARDNNIPFSPIS